MLPFVATEVVNKFRQSGKFVTHEHKNFLGKPRGFLRQMTTPKIFLSSKLEKHQYQTNPGVNLIWNMKK